MDFLEGMESAETRRMRYEIKRSDLKINLGRYSGVVIKTDKQFCDSCVIGNFFSRVPQERKDPKEPPANAAKR